MGKFALRLHPWTEFILSRSAVLVVGSFLCILSRFWSDVDHEIKSLSALVVRTFLCILSRFWSDVDHDIKLV
jgi:hypothetical protein